MKHLCTVLLLMALGGSCGRGKSNNQTASGEDISTLEDRLGNTDPRAKGANTCLLAYAEKYDELLTKDMVTQATGVTAESVDFKYNRVTKNTQYHDVTYSWKGSQQKTIGGMTVPVKDQVKLSGISEISLFTFQSSYRAVSAEEIQKANEKMEQAIRGNSDNTKVNESLKKLEEMGISKEDQKKMMESLTAGAQKMSQGFSAVEKVGDTAMWNSRTNCLYVFKDGAMFEVMAEMSDKERNREVATHIARQILKKCK